MLTKYKKKKTLNNFLLLYKTTIFVTAKVNFFAALFDILI